MSEGKVRKISPNLSNRNKKAVAIVITIIAVLVIGVFGYKEVINDDKQFADRALLIVQDIGGVSLHTIVDDYWTIQEHKYELTDYTLSSRGEEVKDTLNRAFLMIELIYDDYTGLNIQSEETLKSWCDDAEDLLMESTEMIVEIN